MKDKKIKLITSLIIITEILLYFIMKDTSYIINKDNSLKIVFNNCNCIIDIILIVILICMIINVIIIIYYKNQDKDEHVLKYLICKLNLDKSCQIEYSDGKTIKTIEVMNNKYKKNIVIQELKTKDRIVKIESKINHMNKKLKRLEKIVNQNNKKVSK